MATNAFPLRLPAEERAALEHLSKIEGRPMNQLLNEAVKSYLVRRGSKEQALEESLACLRAYRQRDPEFKHAIAAIVEAEATLEDPLEGTVFEGELPHEKPENAGPAQTRIHELLNA